MTSVYSDSPEAARAPASDRRPPADPVAGRWTALHEAGKIVAALADLIDELSPAEIAAFPNALRNVTGWRRTMVEQGIEDIACIMETGITALLSARASGASSPAPARALWDEFCLARAGLLALVPPHLLNRRTLG